jgi:hypothetical protein
MNATVLAPKLESPGPPSRKLADFRLIPRIETYPRVVAFVQTALGKIVLLAVFGLGLRFFASSSPSVLRILGPLALITFLPEYRRFVLAIAPLCLAVTEGGDSLFVIALKLATVAAGIVLFWCARRWPKSLFGRRPIVFLLSGFTLMIVLGCALSRGTFSYRLVWDSVGVAATYVWFIGYALMDRNADPRTETSLELASFHPLWGSTSTPFPKGATYLRRIEAHDAKRLAVVQLKGLKLITWAILLTVLQGLVNKVFHGYLRIPTSAESLAMSANGTPVAWHLRWESQILFFLEVTLSLSIMGHRFIAACRMAGFNALRNTYRPLSSRTTMEFFNRFYYYFKELLVDFFFYPTFLRYWKGHKRLRTVTATFAAVIFGNSFFHITRDWTFIHDYGLRRALVSYQVLFFYSVVLATALTISQLRKSRPKSTGFFRKDLLPIAGVMLFYCLLGIFIDENRLYPLAVHLRYFASLFFIRL